ncbi:hypothetical protein CYLTODRAFT_397289 [Cylindrobasidium torrendii FP15055 ss-10]|uniref:RNA polymerase Rpc34 n=1 Tax=Cylindrobasidium torrendii FP15055 ss-10 TaxID=1314674 RepID=A0A0D7BB09_9AGAR|nr:hypothetical protein CYLTODRAFT_397289 [Cylindrobasidium torrendii FP15055 ss-10]
MSKRRLNDDEAKIHQAVLAAQNHELRGEELNGVVVDNKKRAAALNFLLSVGLLKPLTDKKGVIFRAISKGDYSSTQGLNAEENMVYDHIKSSANEGIWTKHLKNKTNLHQTVIDRCIKTLVSKNLIKRVPSVQHNTRKIYMLASLEPSVALTGGPWYTENELDTEFIDTLKKACLKLITDMTFPDRRALNDGLLYPISNAPKYPTAGHIQRALKKARLTPTELSIEHIEMLLNVLVLDGAVEKVPSFGLTLWNPDAIDEDSDDDSKKKRKKKKRRYDSSSDSDDSSSRKRSKKKKARRKEDNDTESDDPNDDGLATPPPKKKKRSKRRDDSSDSEQESRRKRRRRHSDDEDTASDDDRRRSKSKSKSKSKKRRDDSDSGSDSDDDRRSRSKSRSSKQRQYSASPAPMLDDGDGNVYRAIRQAEGLSLGWSQAPCSKCQSFEFCKEGGPVNPTACAYYGDWLLGKTMDDLDDIENVGLGSLFGET